MFYEVEKLEKDYIELKDGLKTHLIFGSSHRHSKKDFTEPVPKPITAISILLEIVYVRKSPIFSKINSLTK